MNRILNEAGGLLAGYDLVISDVWGVVHDGVWAYTQACAALSAYRAGGGRVVLLSNAPGPSEQIAGVLDMKRVPRDAWDRLVTSGDVTREAVLASGFTRIHHIGTARDAEVFDGLAVEIVAPEHAQVVVATELRDDRSESPEDYRAELAACQARGLPFICGNPDLVVHVGEHLLPCAGSLAAIYEEMGGRVTWCGKPHRPAYELALAQAREVMGAIPGAMPGAMPGSSRVLVIGDALRTDIAGAALMGFDALFIAGGIHRDEIVPGDAIDEAVLAERLAPFADTVVATMVRLA
jgi:HAD superfamily hydrolase (TIGR01459 family)